MNASDILTNQHVRYGLVFGGGCAVGGAVGYILGKRKAQVLVTEVVNNVTHIHSTPETDNPDSEVYSETYDDWSLQEKTEALATVHQLTGRYRDTNPADLTSKEIVGMLMELPDPDEIRDDSADLVDDSDDGVVERPYPMVDLDEDLFEDQSLTDTPDSSGFEEEDVDDGDIPDTGEEVESVTETHNIFSHSTSRDHWDYAKEIAQRGPTRPYIIHQDEYHSNESGFDQLTYNYYAGDDVLVDERGVPVFKHQDRVGNLTFGKGSNDPHVVYVRNPELEVEYEVLYNDDSYVGTQLETAYVADEDSPFRPRRAPLED